MIYENLRKAFCDLQKALERSHLQPLANGSVLADTQSLREHVFQHTEVLSPVLRERLREEYLGLAALTNLVADLDITEILINDHDQIWFEKHGQWHSSEDHFLSLLTYQNFCHRLCGEAGVITNLDSPKADGKWRDFRLCVVQRPLVHSEFQLCLRRQSYNRWNFETLVEAQWATAHEIRILRDLISRGCNLLIVGPTGSGKTSVLNACLTELSPCERVVIIEDTDELTAPNPLSTKLLTRIDNHKILSAVTLSDLVRLSLRIRPDRIVMGEVRGEEAKDLLMAFATGHRGGFGTLHADDAHQALLRLEMLIQLGAPQWNLQSVRQLIRLSLDAIVVVGLRDGRRYLAGISQIASLESFGFTLEVLQKDPRSTQESILEIVKGQEF